METHNGMTNGDFLIFIAPFALTIVLVFGMKYFSAVFQARARIAGETAYRALAEKAVAAQAENQASLTGMRSDLAQLAASLTAIQRILEQVE